MLAPLVEQSFRKPKPYWPADGLFANFRPTTTRAPSGPIDSSCNSPSATANTCPGPYTTGSPCWVTRNVP